MIGDYQKIPPQQGWQCPICGRVYSPTTMMCLYCGNGEEFVSTTFTTGYKVDYVHKEDTTKGRVSDGQSGSDQAYAKSTDNVRIY